MSEQTQEQVAQTLEECGLFDEECPSCKGKGTIYQEDEFGMNGTDYCCGRCSRTGKIFNLPDADQSEAILANMGLQVVWSRFDTMRAVLITYRIGKKKNLAEFEIKRGLRTFANNSALAYISEDHYNDKGGLIFYNMRTELERAIGEVKSESTND